MDKLKSNNIFFGVWTEQTNNLFTQEAYNYHLLFCQMWSSFKSLKDGKCCRNFYRL